MSITDELRAVAAKTECANGRCEKLYRGDLDHIADHIDAEHEKAAAGCIHYDPERHYCSVHGDTENGWVRLPKDADGKTIHVGDVMEWPYGNGEFVVEGIGGNTLFYIDKDSNECEWTAAGDKRHHHAPTVEDVLWEFAEKITDSQIPGVHPTYEEAITEYAAKLRLAGSDVE